MGRLLLACVLGCAIFALAAYQFGLIGQEETPTRASRTGKESKPAPDLGQDLYARAPLPAAPVVVPERKIDPVVVLGTMAVKDRSEIAAQVSGQLLFVGEEIPEGAAQVAGVAAFMAEPFEYTTINQGARDVIQLYRRLSLYETVHADQVLALIDTAKALGDVTIKEAKVVAAEYDTLGSRAIAAEAYNKFRQAEEAYSGRYGKTISLEDFRNAQLTNEKMGYDGISKAKQWDVAKGELRMSQIINKQHRIINKVPVTRSVIQKILKQRGEAVREQEPVMEVYGLDRLLAEAQIDDNYRKRVREGMKVTIEPALVDSPQKIYPGHTATVNCLAVTHDAKNPLIVSGGEDRTVFVWNRFEQSPVRLFKHPEPVKSLAASPRGAAGNLILSGCADGYVRLWDLDAKDRHKALVKEVREHNVAVTAVAFSPDGKYFVSGAADGSMILWTTANMEKVYDFDDKHGVEDAHHGAVTALHFTPQCKLVSASLDNTIHVWSLKEKGAELDYPLPLRSGTVGQIDVSSDGRWLLFDQGKTLQIRAVADDGRLINTLQNPGGAIPFETLALFSPDASLLLTAGTSEGRLQLWHLPQVAARGFEVRKFSTTERAQVTCAAFAPLTDYDGEGSFAVSANKDGLIYLWPLPSRQEVDNYQIRNVPVLGVSPGLNPNTRQISVNVEVPNPPTREYPKGRLEPGRPVTIVID